MGKVRTEDPQLLAAENHPGATHPQGWEWRRRFPRKLAERQVLPLWLIITFFLQLLNILQDFYDAFLLL